MKGKTGNNAVSFRHRIRTNIFAALGSIVALSSLFTLPSYAVDNSVTSNTNVLKVSPVRSDIQIKPGSSQQVPITVTNLTKNDIQISALENDFVAGDEKGTPALILDSTQYAPTHSLKRFMTPISNVIVPANSAKTINVTITVPSTAQAGGYYGAVRLAPSSPDANSQVNLSASVASLILLTVPGPTTEKLNLTNFDIQQNGTTGTNFRTPDNLQLHLRFENKGNIQEGPFGQITVKSGNKTVYSTDFNTDQPRDQVLPDSARYWNIPLKNIGTFGYYKVYATLTYGSNNQSFDITKTFWVVPTWAFFAAAGILVLLIAVVVLIIVLSRRRKRQRRHGSRRNHGGNLRY